MGRDAATVGHRLGHDQARADGGWLPTEVGDGPPGEAKLAIERPDELADVDDLGLELDDEQHPALRVPCDQVDHAALPERRERQFRPNDPATEAPEPSDHGLRERCVASIDKAIEIGVSRSRAELDRDLEDSGDLADRSERHPIDRAALESRDRGGRDPSPARQVQLPPGAADSRRSHRRSEPQVVHRPKRGDLRFAVAQQNARSISSTSATRQVDNLVARVDKQSAAVEESRRPVDEGAPIVDASELAIHNM